MSDAVNIPAMPSEKILRSELAVGPTRYAIDELLETCLLLEAAGEERLVGCMVHVHDRSLSDPSFPRIGLITGKGATAGTVSIARIGEVLRDVHRGGRPLLLRGTAYPLFLPNVGYNQVSNSINEFAIMSPALPMHEELRQLLFHMERGPAPRAETEPSPPQTEEEPSAAAETTAPPANGGGEGPHEGPSADVGGAGSPPASDPPGETDVFDRWFNHPTWLDKKAIPHMLASAFPKNEDGTYKSFLLLLDKKATAQRIAAVLPKPGDRDTWLVYVINKQGNISDDGTKGRLVLEVNSKDPDAVDGMLRFLDMVSKAAAPGGKRTMTPPAIGKRVGNEIRAWELNQ